MIAEYTALRREIEWLIKDSGQYQTYALALIATLPPAFALITSSHRPWLVVPAMLIASATFCLFGFLFFRGHQEVYMVASYLQTIVRPRVREIAGSTALWEWEEYKAQTNTALQRATRMGVLSSPRFILILRLMIFLLPAGAGDISVLVLLVHKGLDWSVHRYSWLGFIFVCVGLMINFLIVAALWVWLWISSDLGRLIHRERPAEGGRP